MIRSCSLSMIILALVGSVSLASAAAQEPRRGVRVVARTPVSEKRVALVIGNGAYPSGTLRNPVRDADSMAVTLKRCGFEVTWKKDCGRKGMLEAIRSFGEQIKGGSVGLFYYAGHGIQVKGENYLVPVDAAIQNEDEAEDWCVQASSVLRKMDSAGNRMNIVILDACRNNPFARSFRSSSQGLARMDAPAGSIVVYATAPGAVASDGEGANGLYTSVLLKYIQRPGVKIEEALKDVRREVMEKTADVQVPWESSSLTGDFYFVLPEGTPGERPGAPSISPPAPPQPVAFGHLQVNVNAPGSKVYVNGTYRGDAEPGSPLNLQNVGTGEVEVRVEARGYEGMTKRYRLVAGQWTQAVLELPVLPPTPVLPVVTPSSMPPQSSVPQVSPGGAGAGTGEMVYVSAGEFLMGSPAGEGADDERPQHTVYLDAYYIDRTEVTVGQYRGFAQATGRGMSSAPSWGLQDDHPVVNVSWNDADAYCRWAKKRLPTEAEWEKAARGTDGRKYPWGNSGPSSGLLNFNNNAGKTTAVGSYPSGASPYGALDMAGNVWEWCADWYDVNYYENSPKSNPTGANTRSYRVLRGGSWFDEPGTVRAASRSWGTPTDSSDGDIGFRCSRTP